MPLEPVENYVRDLLEACGAPNAEERITQIVERIIDDAKD